MEEVAKRRRSELISRGLRIYATMLWLIGCALGLIFALLITKLFQGDGVVRTLQRVGLILLLELLPMKMIIGPAVLFWERRSAIVVNWVLMALYVILNLVLMYFSGYASGYVWIALFFLPYWIMVFLIGHRRWVSSL